MISSTRTMLRPYAFIFYVVLFKEILALQQFDKTPSYTEVNQDENVTLTCVVKNKDGNCSWQKDRKPIFMSKAKYLWAVPDQQKGDCSLRIIKAVAELDEGDWECQVGPKDFNTLDSLSSPSVKLIVRAQPQEPRIEYYGSIILPQQNVTAKSDEKAVLKCVSRYGNPPAELRWFLDNKPILTHNNQTNGREPDNNRTFWAHSILELSVNKSHHGKTITCMAFHETYDTKSRSVSVRLNITYKPDVTLVGIPHHDIEEGKDTVTLRCIADANPPASITWTREGSIAGNAEALTFKPVNRRDDGKYFCVAQNSVGSSQPIHTTLDVKYAPIIQSVGPNRVTSVSLFSHTDFTCSADGNPAPTYQWIQRVPNLHGAPEISSLRSTDPKMRLTNVTYDYQGEYVCVVSNTIAGSERTQQSHPLMLNVLGAPLIMTNLSRHEVIAQRGTTATLTVVLCADPRPRRVAWEWGSMQLEAGAGVGRTKAEALLQFHQEDCYVSRFQISRVENADARKYHLMVENERGVDKHEIRLIVRGSYNEPGISVLFTIAIASVVGLFILIVVVYAIKSRSCCFRRRRRGDFKPKDTESCNNENEKSEINSSNGMKPPKIEAMMDNGLNNDLLYCTSPSRRPPPPHTITAASPDAMKVRLAAMVLQPPTTV